MIIMSPDSPDASSRFLDADLLKAVKSIIRIESGQSRRIRNGSVANQSFIFISRDLRLGQLGAQVVDSAVIGVRGGDGFRDGTKGGLHLGIGGIRDLRYRVHAVVSPEVNDIQHIVFYDMHRIPVIVVLIVTYPHFRVIVVFAGGKFERFDAIPPHVDIGRQVAAALPVTGQRLSQGDVQHVKVDHLGLDSLAFVFGIGRIEGLLRLVVTGTVTGRDTFQQKVGIVGIMAGSGYGMTAKYFIFGDGR